MEWLFVVCSELAVVFFLEKLIRHVKINRDFLVLLELHDQKWISGLPLSEWWIKADTNHEMQLVRLWQNHELLDVLILNLVVVGLAAKSERALVHIDIETSSVNILASPTTAIELHT
jgi:hypothetical protein